MNQWEVRRRRAGGKLQDRVEQAEEETEQTATAAHVNH